MRLGLVSTYPPRRCGLAAYAADLGRALAPEFDVVACAVDRHGLNYPDEVAAVIREDDPDDYRRAARVLAEHGVDVVLIQHDDAVYGGPDGAYVLDLAHELRRHGVPYLVTLHRLPEHPEPGWCRSVAALAGAAVRTLVFTDTAARLAVTHQLVPADRIDVVPVGVPSLLWRGGGASRRAMRERSARTPRAAVRDLLAELDDRPVLASVGLLGPGKGLETAIEALPPLVAEYPRLRLVVAGVPHPDVPGDYRAGLAALVESAGLDGVVRFLDAHLSPVEQATVLARTDVYVAPTVPGDRTCSGMLAAAVTAGCPVVAGSHPYADQVLAAGAGTTVTPADPVALAAAVRGYLADPGLRGAARTAATATGRRLTWPAVTNRYAAIIRAAAQGAGPGTELSPLVLGPTVTTALTPPRPPHASAPVAGPPIVGWTAVRRDRAGRAPADRGPADRGPGGPAPVDHAPADRGSGRADAVSGRPSDRDRDRWDVGPAPTAPSSFVAASGLMEWSARLAVVGSGLLGLATPVLPRAGWRRALAWVSGALPRLATTGATDAGPELDLGWGIWGLGAVADGSAVPAALRARASGLRELLAGWPVIELGASAYAALGLAGPDQIGAAGQDALVRSAGRLGQAWQGGWRGGAWPWFGDRIGVAAPRLPQALIAAGRRLDQPDLVDRGLASLDWYVRRAGLASAAGVLRLPTPVERSTDAGAVVEALVEAYRTTGSSGYARLARRAFGWFHGANRYASAVYDPLTGSAAASVTATDAGRGPVDPVATLSYLGALLALVGAGLAELPTDGAPVRDLAVA